MGPAGSVPDLRLAIRHLYHLNSSKVDIRDLDRIMQGTVALADLQVGLQQYGLQPAPGDPFIYLPSGYTISPDEYLTKPAKPKKKKAVAKKKIQLKSVVLADDKHKAIQEAIAQRKNQDLIFIRWGFADVFEKGTAISLLFWGIPGTGKTMAAQAIAEELGAELKIYGTAEIESQEPGGPERIIQSIFATAKTDEAEGNQRVILFDECDSLLMDRNEVGPILAAQVNALLSEIEHYSGIVIFTTNRLGKLDPALERRITAKIEFPFPTQAQRKAIWQRLIPKKAPLADDVDFDTLSEYSLAGGNIKNAVLNAARSAAYEKLKKKQRRAIRMQHFVEAVERELESVSSFATAYSDAPHHQTRGFQRRVGKVVALKHPETEKEKTADDEIHVKMTHTIGETLQGGTDESEQ